MNCKRCTRWLRITEFPWRWRRVRRANSWGNRPRHDVPTIETTCNACKRRIERERYQSKPLEERQAIGRRVNARARQRRDLEREKLERRLRAAGDVARRLRERHGWEDHVVPLTPFRMWLLVAVRVYGSRAKLAEICGIDDARLRRLVDGYYWEGPLKPRPIHGVSLGTVDKILTAVGEADQIEFLYPWEDLERKLLGEHHHDEEATPADLSSEVQNATTGQRGYSVRNGRDEAA